MARKLLNRADMHDYQLRTSKFFEENAFPGAMAWLSVGSGKTVSTLDFIAKMNENFSFNKALVVSTKRIVKDVWPPEIEKWEQTSGMTVCTREQLLSIRQNRTEEDYLHAKSESKRLEKIIKKKGSKKAKAELKEYRRHLRLMRKIESTEILEIEADIYTINVENFRWLVNTLGSKWPYDMLILDESSLFRNSDSKRFKSAKQIRPYIDTVIELTGSPCPNGYLGLWAQVYLIDQGERLGKTITAYRDKYFKKWSDGFTYKLLPGAEEEIQKLIKDVVISLDPKDYLKLGPEPIHEEFKLELPDNLRKQYQKLERDFFLEVEGDSIMALTEAVKSNKLRQFCNGTVYALGEDEFEDKKKVVQIHDIKLNALKEIVEISNGHPLLVAYEFIPERDKILKAFPKAKTIDQFDQKKWDVGDIEMMVLHPRCLHPSTEVLTEFRGWIKIIDVLPNEKVFDGVEYVTHSGCHYSGKQQVIEVFDLLMTKEHQLLIQNEWVKAEDVQHIERARKKALYKHSITKNCISSMPKLWKSIRKNKTERIASQQTKTKTLCSLFERFLPSNDQYPNMENLERYDPKNYRSEEQRFLSIWQTWCLQKLVKIRQFLSGYEERIQREFNLRTSRQFQRLQQTELSMGYQFGATIQQNKQPVHCLPRSKNAFSGILQSYKNISWGNDSQVKQRDDIRRSCGGLQKQQLQKESKISKVYDLVECGPRNQFIIRNKKGEMFISHNSGGHGLNLQHGGHRVVWYPTVIDLELYDQLNGRVGQLRQAQSGYFRAPIYYHLFFENTIEQDLIRRRNKKDVTQKNLLAAMRQGVKRRCQV